MRNAQLQQLHAIGERSMGKTASRSKRAAAFTQVENAIRHNPAVDGRLRITNG